MRKSLSILAVLVLALATSDLRAQFPMPPLTLNPCVTSQTSPYAHRLLANASTPALGAAVIYTNPAWDAQQLKTETNFSAFGRACMGGETRITFQQYGRVEAFGSDFGHTVVSYATNQSTFHTWVYLSTPTRGTTLSFITGRKNNDPAELPVLTAPTPQQACGSNCQEFEVGTLVLVTSTFTIRPRFIFTLDNQASSSSGEHVAQVWDTGTGNSTAQISANSRTESSLAYSEQATSGGLRFEVSLNGPVQGATAVGSVTSARTSRSADVRGQVTFTDSGASLAFRVYMTMIGYGRWQLGGFPSFTRGSWPIAAITSSNL